MSGATPLTARARPVPTCAVPVTFEERLRVEDGRAVSDSKDVRAHGRPTGRACRSCGGSVCSLCMPEQWVCEYCDNLFCPLCAVGGVVTAGVVWCGCDTGEDDDE